MEAPLRWVQPGQEDTTGKVWKHGSPWMEPDEEWIRDQYEGQGKSVEQIAEDTSASVYCVKKWMECHGVERRQRTVRSDKGKTRGPNRRRPSPQAPKSLRERAEKIQTGG